MVLVQFLSLPQQLLSSSKTVFSGLTALFCELLLGFTGKRPARGCIFIRSHQGFILFCQPVLANSAILAEFFLPAWCSLCSFNTVFVPHTFLRESISLRIWGYLAPLKCQICDWLEQSHWHAFLSWIFEGAGGKCGVNIFPTVYISHRWNQKWM